MTLNEQAVRFFEGCFHDCGNPAFIELALAALREQAERENPKPLTLDELWQMELNEWLWIEALEPFSYPNKISAYYQRHEYGTADGAMKETFACGYPGITFGFDYCDYGKTWLAYRERPEEVQGL